MGAKRRGGSKGGGGGARSAQQGASGSKETKTRRTPSPERDGVPLLDDKLLLALGVFLVGDLLLVLLVLHLLVRSASFLVVRHVNAVQRRRVTA